MAPCTTTPWPSGLFACVEMFVCLAGSVCVCVWVHVCVISSPSTKLAAMPKGQRSGDHGALGELCGGDPRSHPKHHQGTHPIMDQRELLKKRTREVWIWERSVFDHFLFIFHSSQLCKKKKKKKNTSNSGTYWSLINKQFTRTCFSASKLRSSVHLGRERCLSGKQHV